MMEVPRSPKAKCRVLGHRTCVPPWGYYVGLPQSHCTRCGIKLPSHSRYEDPDVPWFDTPSYPEFGDWFWRMVEWFGNVSQRVQKERVEK